MPRKFKDPQHHKLARYMRFPRTDLDPDLQEAGADAVAAEVATNVYKSAILTAVTEARTLMDSDPAMTGYDRLFHSEALFRVLKEIEKGIQDHG